MAKSDKWKQFFEEKRHAPPRKHLLESLKYVARNEAALDLGAGTLRDSKHLLKIGFKEVVAVDKEKIVSYFAKEINDPRLKVFTLSFSEYTFPENHFDLINAQYSLPFAEKETFALVFEKLKNSLKSGGIFAGTFFGVEDSWNVPNGKANVFQTKEELQKMFDGWDVMIWEEEKIKDDLVGKEIKDWHRFHIIVKKP